MCGIFGIHLTDSSRQNGTWLPALVEQLFLLSETRGREAAGLAVRSDRDLTIFKEAQAASAMVASADYKAYISDAISTAGPLSLIGHARLVTNGLQNMQTNNQPVVKGHLVGVHNGIVTNDMDLWQYCSEHARETDVDTEALLACLDTWSDGGNTSLPAALRKAFDTIEGNASLLLLSSKTQGLTGATNNGSLYLAEFEDNSGVVAASEKYILQQLATTQGAPALKEIRHISPGHGFTTGPDSTLHVNLFDVADQAVHSQPGTMEATPIRDLSLRHDEARQAMRRCTRCVLPETMPFITFDADGVCNYCHCHEAMPVQGKLAAEKALQNQRKPNTEAECLLMLSGGRDSCYGLHYAVTELDLKPIAYTYDWGMVTDIARRNASRLCGKLGIEHIIVSANIAWKRKNIRKNIQAWLRKPDLGMVPLFMAGDKQYFYYARKVRKANNLAFSIVSENPLEYTRFKTGFCGVDESGCRIYNISMAKKAKLFSYYAAQYLRNPAYINSTLLDSAFAFWASYFMPHDHFFLFDYVRWEENTIVDTLIDEYGWELDPECASSWRIGDGTAAFYNYIYYTVAGFTENDTLRSNQVREGDLTREEALTLVAEENKPRWGALEWYASVVGFNLLEALQAINAMPKLYVGDNSLSR